MIRALAFALLLGLATLSGTAPATAAGKSDLIGSIVGGP